MGNDFDPGKNDPDGVLIQIPMPFENPYPYQENPPNEEMPEEIK
jgi:hypothetical protein